MDLKDIVSVREQYGNRIRSLREGFWAPYAEALKDITEDELLIDVTVQCLENTRRFIASRMGNLGEATDSGNIAFINYGFDIIAAVVPNLIATELCSVQPMDRRSGEIFFLEFLYGSDKGRISKGEKMFGSRKAGNDPDEVSPEEIFYTSEKIYQENGGVGNDVLTQFTPTLKYTPVRPSTVSISAVPDGGGAAMIVTDNGSGALVGDVDGGGTNTIDYATGDIDVTFSSAVDDGEIVKVTYKWNMEENPSMIPEVDLKITSEAVLAENRALRAFYNVFSAYDLAQAWGRDMDTELEAALAAEIRKEIDGELLEEMRVAQADYAVEFTAASTVYVSQVEHNKEFLNKAIEASNFIYQSTRRAAGNIMVVGTSVANIIESLGSNYFTPAGKPQVGPHFAGVFGNKFRVYKNPYYPSSEWLTLYRGDTFLEAAYVYAPYMPFFTTQLGINEELVGRKAAATSSARKMVNEDFFVRGRLV